MCNCGGGSRYTNNRSAGYASRSGPTSTPQEWIVTFPDGHEQTYTSDSEAYAALRLRGGGIRQRALSST